MTSPAHTIARMVKYRYEDKYRTIYATAEMQSGIEKRFVIGLSPFRVIGAEFTETGRKVTMKPADENSVKYAIFNYGSRNGIIPKDKVRRQNQVIYSVMQEINFYRNELANHAEKVQEKMCGADPLDALIGSSRTLETAAKYWAVRRVLICFAKYTEGNTEAIEAIENELFWLTKDALRGNYSPAIRNYENQLKALALQESVQTLKDAMKREGVE